MWDKFLVDLESAKNGERIVKEQLQKLLPDYIIDDVSNERQYFYKGDLRATDKESGDSIYIEVKQDSRIADTQNVLCEYSVFFDDKGFTKGNMFSDYDIYTIVSQSERKIYVIDFAILKANYKSGKHKIIQHYDQTTYCYLCSLDSVRAWGALIAEINY